MKRVSQNVRPSFAVSRDRVVRVGNSHPSRPLRALEGGRQGPRANTWRRPGGANVTGSFGASALGDPTENSLRGVGAREQCKTSSHGASARTTETLSRARKNDADSGTVGAPLANVDITLHVAGFLRRGNSAIEADSNSSSDPTETLSPTRQRLDGDTQHGRSHTRGTACTP